MKRLIPLFIFGLLAASLAFAAPPPSMMKISLPEGKNFEGITVNPATQKAYVIGELATEGADDARAVFVIDNSVINGKKRPAVIPIPNESEYAAVDSARNLIYVATRYAVEGGESDDEGGGDDVGESSVSVIAVNQVITIAGTLTVIDGKTDTVIASYAFPDGVEPEGVAIDPATGIVYVAAKAPEGESSVDDVCNPWAIPIYDVGEPGDVECWTRGSIYVFLVDPANTIQPMTLLTTIPAGDDPESLVFENGMVYAANEDDGTITIAEAVKPDGSGGGLITDFPQPPTQPYALGIAPYSLGVFYGSGPNPLACVENKFEADKMAAGGGSVFITDDRSRVAKITGAVVDNVVDVPGATVCLGIPNTDGGGFNSANNIGFMQKEDHAFVFVTSEQNTVAVLDPETLGWIRTITIPDALHLDAIAVDSNAGRVWITDEDQQVVFLLQGQCANGGRCDK